MRTRLTDATEFCRISSGPSTPKSALVIGGNGFIGSNVATHLSKHGWSIRIFDRIPAANSHLSEDRAIEFVQGNLLDSDSLRKALQDMDVVLYFASHSIPSSNPKIMTDEIEGSLKSLDHLLTLMLETKAMLVFPSSGGTVYGVNNNSSIAEDDPTAPVSSYGMGKLLSEELIGFYHRVHGLKYQILRIANVYGCHIPRKVNQGVVEIFLNRVMRGEPLNIWGNSQNIRDYIFIDDLCCAVERILAVAPESSVFNVGTGLGHTVTDVISAIETVTGKSIQVNFVPAPEGTLSSNVLDIKNIRRVTAWYPKFSLSEGIRILSERMSACEK